MISSITTPDALPATLPRDVTVPPVPGFLSHAAATAIAAPTTASVREAARIVRRLTGNVGGPAQVAAAAAAASATRLASAAAGSALPVAASLSPRMLGIP